jgi:hypothetical protein
MGSATIHLALVAAVVTAGLSLAVFLLLRKGQRRAELLGPAFELGTSRHGGFLRGAVDGMYRGYSCRYLIQYPSQYDRGGAALKMSIAAAGRWTAEIEKPGSRLLAKFGLVKDFEIGDRELDALLRFAGSDEGSLRALFGTEAVREALRALTMSENFERVHVHPDRIDIRWSPRVRRLDENPDALRTRLELVTTLLTACGYPPATTPTAP